MKATHGIFRTKSRSQRTRPAEQAALSARLALPLAAALAPSTTTESGTLANARARLVNRVHRVVRAEAESLREQQRRRRGLWVPLALFTALMATTLYAIWAMFDGYDISPNGIPDASDQMALLLLWSVPVTAVVLGLILFQRGRARAAGAGETPR